MEQQIKNQFLTVTINDIGAELTSVFDEEKGRQVLWTADPAFWGRHAPLLFPNVGKHYRCQYRHQGKTYSSTLHGFAKDAMFTCIRKTDTSVTHQLQDTAVTHTDYPFSFVLEVTHTIEGSSLHVDWKVTNTGEEQMYFTIGGHPGFLVPIVPDASQTDYHLLFARDTLFYKKVDLSCGCVIPGSEQMLPLRNKSCPITAHMFDEDALVFDHQIDWAAIANPDGTPYISIRCPGFSSFGIWTLPGAPYLCLEPWDGRCDDVGFEGDISQKPDILSLSPQEIYQKRYTIQIH